jgi:lysophospholipase L1-like esterase
MSRRRLSLSIALNVILAAALLLVGRHYGLAGDVANRLGLADAPAVDFREDDMRRAELYGDEPHDIVMFGDSLTQTPQWGELLDDESVANRGLGGDTLAGMRSRVDRVLALQPEVVFVLGGSNDTSARRDLADMRADAQAIVDGLTVSGTTVVLQTVPPQARTRPRAEAVNADIRDLNRALAEIAAGADDVVLLDLWSLLEDDGFLAATYSLDGLHLTADGYAIWTREVRRVLDGVDE